jgi:NitT/TauT family transport system substrate-binding protein
MGEKESRHDCGVSREPGRCYPVYHNKPRGCEKRLTTYANMSEQLLQLVNVPSVTVAASPAQMKFWIDLMDKQQLTTGAIDPQSIIAP